MYGRSCTRYVELFAAAGWIYETLFVTQSSLDICSDVFLIRAFWVKVSCSGLVVDVPIGCNTARISPFSDEIFSVTHLRLRCIFLNNEDA